ncbi:alpha/beta hydrolase [Curtobacterium sp. MCJR17_055]|nr:alpha/beta hydrolase [Curtobacterium sp. MCBD17_029]PYY57013.1 alpha/beta hydrolase [Curtobacterium sp. MCJR17_055]PYY62071.1 alpha/beta hydrolase [Curtobacterium sp. MCPF17_015]
METAGRGQDGAATGAETQGATVTGLDRRTRVLGRLIGLASVTRRSEAQIIADQRRVVGHNAVTDLLLGGLAPGVGVRDTTAAGQDGPIGVRLYRPTTFTGTPPLVVLLHGGGWTSGTLDTYDWLASNIARDARVVVASLDYRLAPRHRWPAAAEDSYAATVDLVGRAGELGADTSRVAVVGDSAGGNLAAVVALMARDRSGPAIAFQALLYPATDLTMASPSIDENATAPILTKADMLAFRQHYLGGADPREPYASPLSADLTGLPPALVQVAEHDPLRDDGLRFAAALQDAGVTVRTTTYFGMPHGFMAFPRISRAVPQALGELCQELRRALAVA